MANQYIQLTTDTNNTGKKVDVSELTVGAHVVQRQRMVLADDTTAANVAKVRENTPASNDYGLVTQSFMYGTTTAGSPRRLKVDASDHLLTHTGGFLLSGSTALTGAANAIVWTLDNAAPSLLLVQLTRSGGTSATVLFQASTDNINWTTLPVTLVGDDGATARQLQAQTFPGLYRINVAGAAYVRWHITTSLGAPTIAAAARAVSSTGLVQLSDPLPAGTNNIGLVTLASGTNVVGATYDPDLTGSGSLSGAGSAATATLGVQNRHVSSVAFTVSGTYSGLQVAVEAATDGINFYQIPYTRNTHDNTAPTLFHGAGSVLSGSTIYVNPAGAQAVRVRCTSLSSGLANVQWVASRATNLIQLGAPLPAGVNFIGATRQDTGTSGSLTSGGQTVSVTGIGPNSSNLHQHAYKTAVFNRTVGNTGNFATVEVTYDGTAWMEPEYYLLPTVTGPAVWQQGTTAAAGVYHVSIAGAKGVRMRMTQWTGGSDSVVLGLTTADFTSAQPRLAPGAAAVGHIGLGNKTGKTKAFRSSSNIVSFSTNGTTTNLDTYTVPAGQTFYLQSVTITVRPSAGGASSAHLLGFLSLVNGSTTMATYDFQTDANSTSKEIVLTFADPLPFSASETLKADFFQQSTSISTAIRYSALGFTRTF